MDAIQKLDQKIARQKKEIARLIQQKKEMISERENTIKKRPRSSPPASPVVKRRRGKSPEIQQKDLTVQQDNKKREIQRKQAVRLAMIGHRERMEKWSGPRENQTQRVINRQRVNRMIETQFPWSLPPKKGKSCGCS